MASVFPLPSQVITHGGLTELEACVGATNSNQLDINIKDADATVTVAGAVKLKANEAADGSGTERHVLCDTASHLQVDVVSAASTAVTNAGTFAVQAALQAGTNAIGKLAANSGVDIGDVDVTSIAAGTNVIGGVKLKANEAADGSGTERHVLCDSGGRLQVDVIDGGGGGLSSASVVAQSITIPASSSGAGAEIDVDGFSSVAFFGDSEEYTNPVQILASATSGGTFYQVGEVYPRSGAPNIGDFYFAHEQTALRYYKVQQANSSGSGKALTLKVSRR